MHTKKAPLNILRILEHPALRSITELPVIGILHKQSTDPPFFDIQSNRHPELEYQAFALEQSKKLPEAILTWYKTLHKKKKLIKDRVPAQAAELADIVCSRYLNFISRGKHMKAYFLLGVLEKLTGKNRLKFPDKQRFRSKLLIQQDIDSTGFYYAKQKKFNAGLEFVLKAAELARRKGFTYEEVTANALAGYIACRLGNHRLAADVYKDNLHLLAQSSLTEQLLSVVRVVSLYNLTVECLHMYLRKDAEQFADLARDAAEGLGGYVLLKNKVGWLADEVLRRESALEPLVPESPEQSEPKINFIPGGLDEGDMKLVKLQSESLSKNQ